jgi:hypothetical protein
MSRKPYFFVLIILVTITAFLVTGCFTTGAASVQIQNEGAFGEHIRTPVKDFVPVGIVFTENQFRITSKDIKGEIFTYQALLKEAEKRGADAIINVVIDKKIEVVSSGFNTEQQETWYGSALAIKYTDTLKQTVTVTISNDTGTTTTSTEGIYLNDSGDTVQPDSGTAAEPQPKAGSWLDRFRIK